MKFLKRVLLANLAVILAIVVSLTIFSLTPWGRVFGKTALLLPEVWPNAPVHLLNLFTKAPIVEEIEISSGQEKNKVYVYRPNDLRRHPAIILTMSGVLPTSDTIINYAKSFARVGFVIVVPDFPEISIVEKVSLKTEQVDRLINIFQSISQKEFVNPQKIGFMGACGGGSLSLVAAEDPLVSSQVNFVIAISPYFDAQTTYEQIYRKIIKEDSNIQSWNPNPATVLTTDRLLITTLAREEERRTLEKFIEEGKKEKPSGLSPDGEKIYNFITNSDSERFFQFWNDFPGETKKVLAELSPSTRIENLKARIFILSDNRDTYIPHTESQALARSLSASQRNYIELDLLEHSQLMRKLPRLKTVIELAKLSSFVFKILARIS